MTKLELALQKELSRSKINLKDCKECQYLQINKNKHICNFKGEKLEDCRLASILLYK